MFNNRLIHFALLAIPLVVACRKQTEPVLVDAGSTGAGTGFTASCNGEFPSWISNTPPLADASRDVNPHEPGQQKPFELAQSYPLGIPVLVGNQVDHYDPPAPDADAPWRTWSNLADPAQRSHYLDALKNYLLENMPRRRNRILTVGQS